MPRTSQNQARMLNSYPLYMFDSDARCGCGAFLTHQRDHHCGGRTGHREGYCAACGVWTQYDRALGTSWPRVKADWKRGKPLDRAQAGELWG